MKKITIKYSITCAIIAISGMAAMPSVAADSAAKASATPKAQAEAPKTKQQLVQRLLELWPVQNVGLTMLQAPLEDSLRQSRSMLQARATPENQAAALKDIEGYVKEFMEKLSPVVLESAKKLIPTAVVPILSEKLTEEELRQVISILESPAKAKFEALVPDITKSLGQKIAAEEAPEISPKMAELQKRIGLRLREAVAP